MGQGPGSSDSGFLMVVMEVLAEVVAISRPDRGGSASSGCGWDTVSHGLLD